MDAKPETGEFHVRVGRGPASAGRSYERAFLFEKMARAVAAVTDNREYELVARIGKWEPANPPFEGERLEVDFTLVLLDPLTAEVGEWVKHLPHWVPECKRTVILGEGHGEATGRLFRRVPLGWERVE